MKNKLIYLYPLILVIYSIYSFSQTVPNLVISSNFSFWEFQQTMWQLGYQMRTMSSVIYGILMTLMFGGYLFILSLIKKKQINGRQLVLVFGLSAAALIPSYPALSSDVFNYLMNAKIMQVYHANPYTHAAWDFPADPWLKFMMNVHTTTPYGVVWTGLGYVIYWLTMGDLQFGMLGFRFLGIMAVTLISWSIWVISNKKLISVALFCLNPLVLIESINNAHNDITMMAFFMIGLAVYSFYKQRHKVGAAAGLIILWTISVYTKLVTVIAPAVYLGYFPIRKRVAAFANGFDLLTLALVVGMAADGSKRFFSWYLLWALPISTLAKNKLTRGLLAALSFGGLFSYLPHLYTGEYTSQLESIRYAIYFVPGLLYIAGYLLRSLLRKYAR